MLRPPLLRQPRELEITLLKQSIIDIEFSCFPSNQSLPGADQYGNKCCLKPGRYLDRILQLEFDA